VSKLNNDEQVSLAEVLQAKWLKQMDKMFDAGTITSTDMATLARVLLANGWSLDPSKLPEKLRNKLIDSEELNASFEELPVRLVR
jgi:hypothetical protein